MVRPIGGNNGGNNGRNNGKNNGGDNDRDNGNNGDNKDSEYDEYLLKLDRLFKHLKDDKSKEELEAEELDRL